MTKKILTIVFTVFILLAVLLSNVVFFGTSKSTYLRLQSELGISETTGISEDGLYSITESIIDYLLLKTDNLQVLEKVNGVEREIFNQRELDHMEDVRVLFLLSYGVLFLLAAAIVFRVVLLHKENNLAEFYKEAKASFISSLVITSLVAVIFVTNFQKFWIVFHEVFFFNDLYILNPETDILIQMMPLQFFLKISTRIAVSFLITHAGLLIITWFGVKRDDKKNRR
jgi:integral membrane protein (TIGR01906 family)